MCGIFAVIGDFPECKIAHYRALSARQSHRGPDERHDALMKAKGLRPQVLMCHERLMIMDLQTGAQPIAGCTPDAYVAHNGEIYNQSELREQYKTHKMHTTCDSEVIVHMLEDLVANKTHLQTACTELCNQLDGVFAFIAVAGEQILIARDPIGVKPLYYGRQKRTGLLLIASEMKCLVDECDEQLATFPPGHFYTPSTGFVKYFEPRWLEPELCTDTLDSDKLREALIEATRKRLMSDVPLAVLLSGGLDSSLVSSIVARLSSTDEQLKERGTLQSFSIGVDKNSPDIVAARKVSKFLKTEHHEVYFTVEEGIEVLKKLVWHLESYDTTTLRASTPMYILTDYIRRKGIKVLLSGEGADEILGGYLYFHNAPSDQAFQAECIDRVLRLSTADCLRADKSVMAHSIEVRVPFLDKSFLETALGISPEHKRPRSGVDMEKKILRAAFDDENDPWLPHEVLWRQKEQFSDGVGYSWIDSLKHYCEQNVTDAELASASIRFPHNTPKNKEAYFIRQVFAEYFPGDLCARTVSVWTPKWQLSEDPSGRASQVHLDHTATTSQPQPTTTVDCDKPKVQHDERRPAVQFV